MNEMSPIDSLKGIGEKTKAVFERAGISDIGDLLHDYPRGYESYEPVTPLGEIYDIVVEDMDRQARGLHG